MFHVIEYLLSNGGIGVKKVVSEGRTEILERMIKDIATGALGKLERDKYCDTCDEYNVQQKYVYDDDVMRLVYRLNITDDEFTESSKAFYEDLEVFPAEEYQSNEWEMHLYEVYKSFMLYSF